MNRIERLAATLDEPLLVTGLVNVQYLTGFATTRARSSLPSRRRASTRRATRPSTRTSDTRTPLRRSTG